MSIALRVHTSEFVGTLERVALLLSDRLKAVVYPSVHTGILPLSVSLVGVVACAAPN
jgi:hypothetical protein